MSKELSNKASELSTIESMVIWASEKLHEIADVDEDSLQWRALNGDAGFRKYFRLCSQEGACALPSVLAVYAPPETENCRQFVNVARFFLDHGIHVPSVIATNYDKGFLLIEDLGPSLLLEHLSDDNADLLYGEALISLLRIQQCPTDYSLFPPYDRDALRAEMELFRAWFVPQLLDYNLNDDENAMIDALFEMLEQSALLQPQVVVHRDFHSRNIVHYEVGAPGLIDFQDAVIGPVTYDLVSILKDCYIEWDRDKVRRWAVAYANMAIDVGIMPSMSEEVFLKWFDFMGLQRHIKVLGIFARLSLRDGKHSYLNDLSLVLRYTRDVLGQYAELAGFASWFDQALMPIINKQAWMESCD